MRKWLERRIVKTIRYFGLAARSRAKEAKEHPGEDILLKQTQDVISWLSDQKAWDRDRASQVDTRAPPH
jgi:hypothetical protein